MRADRLVAILMLLQSHGPMTAAALAEALEVSVRTIYRDMDALSAAGVPVYAERGPGGGCRLIENYRSDLTGLTEDEAGALALLVAPGPLDQLEVGRKLKAALRKLYGARRAPPGSGGNGGPRVHLDWAWWGQGAVPASSLEALYRAAEEGRRVRVAYRLSMGIEVERTVEPLGLVGKAGAWYLVHAAHGKVGHHAVSDLLRVEMLPESFAYPENFDLAAYWQAACVEIEAAATEFRAIVRAAPSAIPALRSLFGEHAMRALTPVSDVVSTLAAGNIPALTLGADHHAMPIVELRCANLVQGRTRLLALGSAVEVLDPPALRLSLADHAQQTASLYASAEQN